MKVKTAVLIILSIISSLTAVRSWNLYTNTTHIYDFEKIGDEIYIATWGGVEVYNLKTGELTNKFVRESGFESMKIHTIEYSETTGDILFGSDEDGVFRYNDGKFLISLKNENGLPDNNVNDMIMTEDLIYVATDLGLAVYENKSEYPFPLVENIFNSSNGMTEDIVESIVLTEDNYLLCIRSSSIDYVHADSMLIKNSWHTLRSEDLGEDVTDLICCSENNNLVALSVNNGLLIWPDFPVGMPYASTVPDIENGAYPLYIDEENNIWTSLAYWDINEEVFLNAGTTELVKIKNDGTYEITDIQNVTDKAISKITLMDDRLYLGSWGDGIIFEDTDNEWVSIKTETICTNPVTEIEADDNGRIWVCNGFIGVDETKSGAKGVSVFDYSTDSWETYSYNNSDLVGNNIFTLCAADNQIWMGAFGYYLDVGWLNGVTVIQDVYTEDEAWFNLTRSNGLAGNTIGHISVKSEDEIWVSSYGSGVVSYNISSGETTVYSVPGRNQTVEIMILGEDTNDTNDDQIWFGSKHDGLKVLNGYGVPESSTDYHWELVDAPELRASCEINGFAHYNRDGKDDYWITSNKGVFFYDNVDKEWHKLGVIYKRETLINGRWQIKSDYDKYYVDETKLYGAENATPTCIEIDADGDVWIGTADYGISVYNYENDSYTLFDKDNTPLMTNFITDLEFEGHSGRMYIGTTDGLVSVEVGKDKRTVDDTSDMIVYPNPFYPDKGDVVKIRNSIGNGSMPSDSYMCRIFDVSGKLVIEMEQNSHYDFDWNGKNLAGKDCSSGIYYYVVYDNDGDVQKGKIALIR